MRLMRCMVVMTIALGMFLGVVQAQELSGSDSEVFRRIISSQIQAFRADDGVAAYSYAAPAIKKIFPSPEIFMQMVRNGYLPVYRPRSYSFGAVTNEMNGRPTQRVTIIDANGKAWVALYSFEKQADGTWKIIGCSLVESQGGEA
ncbi:MAG TPA: DUF4864 domain-containing protein [Aestuariivirgaceae bacterium]